LLTSKVTTQTTDSSSSAHAMFYLYKNIKSLVPKSKMDILTDADVDAGNIFTTKNGFNKYDILVIGHQEYVTEQEYDNLRHFVRNGGTMIILDGNIFYAEVTYNRNTQTITLAKGHGWTFNGVSAWKSVNERWKSETSEWVGSNYLCYRCGITFDNDPFEYKQHEEQYITNPNDVILFNYGASMPKHNKQSLVPSSSKLLSASSELNIGTKHIIATYELSYHKGKVIAFGIYADDIITNKKFDKYFDKLLLRYVN
jgi:N,N-dimethylformamidase beta subunit-like protein